MKTRNNVCENKGSLILNHCSGVHGDYLPEESNASALSLQTPKLRLKSWPNVKRGLVL